MSIMCRHLSDNRSDRLANFVRLTEFFVRPYVGKYVSQAILCQIYGLAQMKKLPDLPKFCLVCLAGPVLNDNTGQRKVINWHGWILCMFMHQSFVTMARVRGIAGIFTFLYAKPDICPALRGYFYAQSPAKSPSQILAGKCVISLKPRYVPTIPGPIGAGLTNDWCINSCLHDMISMHLIPWPINSLSFICDVSTSHICNLT